MQEQEFEPEKPQGDDQDVAPEIPQPPEPSQSRLTLISYAVMFLLVILWPVSSLVYFDGQFEFDKEVANLTLEIYLPTMIMQLVILTAVFAATFSERNNSESLGMKGFNKWTIPQAVFFLIAANMILSLLQGVIAQQSPSSFSEFSQMLPKTQPERLVWLLLSGIVAVSEEVTFRGYLVSRITTLARGRLWIGLIISALAFASGHLYQGSGGFIIITVYGLMFSALYLATGSIYPGIIAHFLQDAIAAFLY